MTQFTRFQDAATRQAVMQDLSMNQEDPKNFMGKTALVTVSTARLKAWYKTFGKRTRPYESASGSATVVNNMAAGNVSIGWREGANASM